MANSVFFSFHYQDVIEFRANVVRNHWVAKADRVAAGFYDASIWEETNGKAIWLSNASSIRAFKTHPIRAYL